MSAVRSHVVIVGAGPVGLVTALCCAQRGLSVRVVDRSQPPIDKPCGEGLMPDGVARLEALGLDLSSTGGRPFRGIRYLDGERSIVADFPSGPGIGVRRTRLHRMLLDAAHRAGARVDFGRTVRGINHTNASSVSVTTDSGELEGSWLVGADGLSSRVRRWSGLDDGPVGTRMAVRRHYHLRPWTDHVEVYWVDHREAYVTPVGVDQVGVAILCRGRGGRFDDLLESFPALVARLEGAEVASKDRGCGPLERRVRAVTRGRVALVGDAAGYVDAITGEGLTTGIAQAEALSEALLQGRLATYRRAHRRIVARPNLMTRALLAIEARPWLRRRAMRALAADPALFSRLLEIHVGERAPTAIGWRGVLGASRLLVAERPLVTERR